MILKLVPRDLLFHLPIPKRIRDYLNTPFYYSEAIADWTDENNPPVVEDLSDERDEQESVQTSQPPVPDEPAVQSDSRQEEDSAVASSSSSL